MRSIVHSPSTQSAVQGTDQRLNNTENRASQLQPLQPTGLLHPRQFLLLYYRRDVLQGRLGLQLPDTWEGLVQLVRSARVQLNQLHAQEEVEEQQQRQRREAEEEGPSQAEGGVGLSAVDVGVPSPTSARNSRSNSNSSGALGLPRHALCLDLAPYCKDWALAMAVAAPYLQRASPHEVGDVGPRPSTVSRPNSWYKPHHRPCPSVCLT